MIKHIIFDLGGVLIDLDMPRCLESFRALGVDPTVLLQPSAESAQQGRARATCVTDLLPMVPWIFIRLVIYQHQTLWPEYKDIAHRELPENRFYRHGTIAC